MCLLYFDVYVILMCIRELCGAVDGGEVCICVQMYIHQRCGAMQARDMVWLLRRYVCLCMCIRELAGAVDL